MCEVVECRVVIERFKLCGDGVDNLVTPVANIDAPKTANSINQSISFTVENMCAFSGNDCRAAPVLLERVQVGKRLNEMRIRRKHGVCLARNIKCHLRISLNSSHRCNTGIEPKSMPQ